MKLTELYEKLGGSCTDVLQRIPSEQMLLKFVKLYPADPSEGRLEAAVEAKDWQTAFRAAHTLTGSRVREAPEGGIGDHRGPSRRPGA